VSLSFALRQRRKGILVFLLIFLSSTPVPCFASVVSAQQESKPKGASEQAVARQQLYLLGQKISKAVLDKDIATLLSYDRADLRAGDEIALRGNKSSLYCFILDSSCIKTAEWRSVYEKLSKAHELTTRATVNKSVYNGQLYGSLLFYDRSSISAKDLQSRKFLCAASPQGLVSWTFRFEDGKWKSVTPLFGEGTDGLCGE
jgi:hypothetical protein